MTAIEFLDEPPDYRPGACNIGPAEVARRRRAGIAGLTSAVIVGAVLVATGAPPITRLAIAAPLYFGLMGLVQAQLRFCVAFGMGGLRNFGALGTQSRVADDAARRADRRKAVMVAGGVAALSGLIAVGLALLPF
jgi:hypothetical protein